MQYVKSQGMRFLPFLYSPVHLCTEYFIIKKYRHWSFLSFKLMATIHCHYKAWKSQGVYLYNSDCVHLKEESHILPTEDALRVSKS